MKRYLRVLTKLIFFGLVILVFFIGHFFSKIPLKNGVASLEADNDEGAPALLKSLVGEYKANIDFENIPAILVNSDSASVLTKDDYEKRKAQMMTFFHTEVYGKVPDDNHQLTFEELSSERILENRAIRKQIKMTISTEHGSTDALILAYIPISNTPVPAIVGFNFKGNSIVDGVDTVLTSYGNLYSDDELRSRSGERADRWPYEKLVKAGYALFTVCANDFAPDTPELFDTRLIRLFPGKEVKAIAAWSFGMQRVIDYLETDDRIANDKIITFGHSRMGKTSLLTAANDERVAMAIANGSGNTGAALSRGSYGETIKIVNSEFPHWFLDSYRKYNSKEYEMPFDQHMLLASIAPRKIYVSSSTRDLWAFPEGEYASIKLASEAYRLYGYRGDLPEMTSRTPRTIHNEFFGYHIKEERHKITSEDWHHYVEYMDKHLK